jgi:hypothetical protein
MKVTYRHLELLFFTKSGGARAGWGPGARWDSPPTFIHVINTKVYIQA